MNFNTKYIDKNDFQKAYIVKKLTKTRSSSNYIIEFNNQFYALKKLKNNSKAELLKSYNREIEFLNFFKEDPQVVNLAGYFQNENSCYIITEYCSFGDLGNFLDQQESISRSLFCNIIVELVNSIYFLHANKFYHGDIKPSNFFVKSFNENTQDIEIVIGDFGFAKDLDSNTSLIPYGYTPFYAAPEIVENINQPVSLAADIFSLGMTMESVHDYCNKAPDAFTDLFYEMCNVNPSSRPIIEEIAERIQYLL